MSLVFDVRPDDNERHPGASLIHLRLPDGGGVITLRVQYYTRQNPHRPAQTHYSVRAVIDAPQTVEIARDDMLRANGVDFAAWAEGAIDLRDAKGMRRSRATRVS